MKLYSDCTVATLDEFIKTLQKDSKPKIEDLSLDLGKYLTPEPTKLDSKPSLNERKLALQERIKNDMEALLTPEEFKKVTEAPNTRANTVSIEKSKLLNTYSKVSYELKAFLRLLFEDELFVEQTYKVGNKFSRRRETLVIAKVNANVVTMLDCNTFENFGTSKQVIDINAITESELKCLLGVWRHEFNLIK
jgi:hypothetical protein